MQKEFSMFARRALLSTSLSLCAAWGVLAQPTALLDSQSGTGSGTWELPSGSGASDGYIEGTLLLSPGGTFRYEFSAVLTDVWTPCLSCITGTIDGYLDDGFGPAPDFVVKGTYSGSALTGKGTFTCDIRRPGSTVNVGKIDGTFADPPGSTTLGTFKADWKINQ